MKIYLSVAKQLKGLELEWSNPQILELAVVVAKRLQKAFWESQFVMYSLDFSCLSSRKHKSFIAYLDTMKNLSDLICGSVHSGA